MPGLNGTGPAGMGPMTGGGRGWCNPYNPLYAGYVPYPPPYAYRPYYAPVAWGYTYRPYWGYPWAYGLWRPHWGLRGFWGRGGRGRRRWW